MIAMSINKAALGKARRKKESHYGSYATCLCFAAMLYP